MIIAISGSVGSGKTTLAKALGEKLKYKVIFLNEIAEEFKIEDVEDLQTFDFDLKALMNKVEEIIKENLENDENLILEGHFAHFINPKLVDYLFVVNRDLQDLKKEYEIREYNEQKIADNLEVESFNVCFYEAEEEGYEEGKFFAVENSSSIDCLVSKVCKKIGLKNE